MTSRGCNGLNIFSLSWRDAVVQNLSVDSAEGIPKVQANLAMFYEDVKARLRLPTPGGPGIPNSLILV